jgi:high-affinity nickel-transport protein
MNQPRSHPDGTAQFYQCLIVMSAFIALLHIVGWGTLLAIVVPQHLSVGTAVFGIGIGITAYMLGVRHAFDADHIAAIDNTTRNLLQAGKQPVSVGFWFSCGHSSVVFGLTLLLAFGVRAIAQPALDSNSGLHGISGLVGTVVSSGFLYAIAALNVVVLGDIWVVFRGLRRGQFDEAALERQLNNRGMMTRLIGQGMQAITQPWQMYLVGLLFGLGFDTATEIALLVLTSSNAASGLPWYAILCLPVLFAAGMSLFDTIDGSFMTAAYGWALAKPLRKVYYNFVITGLSVAVAFIVGTVEIMSLVGDRFGFHDSIWRWVTTLNLNVIGFAIVGLFVSTWIVAGAIWRYGRFEVRNEECSFLKKRTKRLLLLRLRKG